MPLLRSYFPAEFIFAPTTEARQFTPEWWVWRGEYDKWQLTDGRSNAVLLVLHDLVEPTFSPDIWADSEPDASVKIIPYYELARYQTEIKRGNASWCLLTDAIELLRSDLPKAPSGPDLELIALRNNSTVLNTLRTELADLESHVKALRRL
jgi:hypothetical protein